MLTIQFTFLTITILRKLCNKSTQNDARSGRRRHVKYQELDQPRNFYLSTHTLTRGTDRLPATPNSPLSMDRPGGRGSRMTHCHQPPCPGGRLCRIPGLAQMHDGGGVTACADRYATYILHCCVVCICLLFRTETLKLWFF